MCGINIIVDREFRLDDSPIQKMNKATLHRGPDSHGFVTINTSNYRVFLGNTRLRINEISQRGDQPYSDRENQCFLTYNGELYNKDDLKNELIRQGVRFTSNCDTEVLFHFLKRSDELYRLNGMFAFAFLNTLTNQLMLVRDRSGIKPLFYYNDDNYFIASSEIRGILSSGLVRKVLNEKQVNHYLQFKHAIKPETFYKDIFEVEEGNRIIIDNDFNIASYPLHEQDPVDLPGSAALVEEVENRLEVAILKQFQADVPIGLFLSGGIDSTLILSLLYKNGIRQVPTFSITFNDKLRKYGTDDHKFARLASKQYDSLHEEIVIRPDSLDHWDDYIDRIDQPVGDSASFLTYLLSREASQSVKVALSGAGGDEYFAGYNRHKAFRYYLKNRKFLTKLNDTFLKQIVPLLNVIPGSYQRRHLLKLIHSIDKDPTSTYSKFVSFNEFYYSQLKEIDSLDKALVYDRYQYLISDVLTLSDRMTMANGMELRVPYLDNDVTSLAGMLNGNFLLKNGPKWILKEILSRNRGGKFIQRKKEGFGMPLNFWKEKGFDPRFTDIFNKDNCILCNFVEGEKLQSMFDPYKKSFEVPLTWSVLLLAHWLERNFG